MLRDLSHRGTMELSFPDTVWACNLYLLYESLIRLSTNHTFKHHGSRWPLNKCLHIAVSTYAFLSMQQCQRKLKMIQVKWSSQGSSTQNQCSSISPSETHALVAYLCCFWPFGCLNSAEAMCSSMENYEWEITSTNSRAVAFFRNTPNNLLLQFSHK